MHRSEHSGQAQEYAEEYAQAYTARSRRVLGIVEQRFILRPGTGANDVYTPPPIPPDPPPPAPITVN